MKHAEYPLLNSIAFLVCLMGSSGKALRTLLAEQRDESSLDESINVTVVTCPSAKFKWWKYQNDSDETRDQHKASWLRVQEDANSVGHSDSSSQSTCQPRYAVDPPDPEWVDGFQKKLKMLRQKKAEDWLEFNNFNLTTHHTDANDLDEMMQRVLDWMAQIVSYDVWNDTEIACTQ